MADKPGAFVEYPVEYPISMPDPTANRLHHVPEAMAALELELTTAQQSLAELTKQLEGVLNPNNIVESSTIMQAEKQRAPLAERIWMNVQTVQQLRNAVLSISTRLEL